MTVTSDRLLTGVKRRVTIPASQVLLSDADILALADDATKEKAVPLIRSVRQDFFVTKSDVDFVANQKYYAIPYRAIGRTLRDLKLVDNSGNRRDMALIAIEDEHYYVPATIPVGFFFFGDKIAVVPTPTDDTYGLEIWWEMPPSDLIPVSDAGVVASFTSTTVTLSSVPSTLTTGTVIDFIQGTSGNSILQYDRTILNISGNTLTFATDDIPSDLAVGDYISVKQTTPVVMLPNEAYPYLETITCLRVLDAISDYEGKERLMEDEKVAKTNLLQMLEPRVEGEATIIVNRTSLLRGRRGSFLTSGYYF